jgi:hypothetical protein
MLLAVVITAASVQDRDAARPLLWNLHRACRPIRLIWADAVYTGKLSGWAASLKMAICIMAGRNPHALRGAAPPVGCGADVRLDQQAPPHHPRVRAPPGQPRSHGLVGHDRPHGGPPSPARPFIKHPLKALDGHRPLPGRRARKPDATQTIFLCTSIPATRGWTISIATSLQTPILEAGTPPAEPATRSRSCDTRSQQQSGVPAGQAPASALQPGTQRQGATTSAGAAQPQVSSIRRRHVSDMKSYQASPQRHRTGALRARAAPPQ